MLKEFGTCSAVQPGACSIHSDLDCKEFQADATDSDIFEYISRDIDSDDPSPQSQDHPPGFIFLLDDPKKLDSGSKGPVLAHRGIENTDPLIEKLEARVIPSFLLTTGILKLFRQSLKKPYPNWVRPFVLLP
jgi:hypothetical protein